MISSQFQPLYERSISTPSTSSPLPSSGISNTLFSFEGFKTRSRDIFTNPTISFPPVLETVPILAFDQNDPNGTRRAQALVLRAEHFTATGFLWAVLCHYPLDFSAPLTPYLCAFPLFAIAVKRIHGKSAIPRCLCKLVAISFF